MEVPALPAWDAHPPPVTHFPDLCYFHFSGKPCATVYNPPGPVFLSTEGTAPRSPGPKV